MVRAAAATGFSECHSRHATSWSRFLRRVRTPSYKVHIIRRAVPLFGMSQAPHGLRTYTYLIYTYLVIADQHMYSRKDQRSQQSFPRLIFPLSPPSALLPLSHFPGQLVDIRRGKQGCVSRLSAKGVYIYVQCACVCSRYSFACGGMFNEGPSEAGLCRQTHLQRTFPSSWAVDMRRKGWEVDRRMSVLLNPLPFRYIQGMRPRNICVRTGHWSG